LTPLSQGFAYGEVHHAVATARRLAIGAAGAGEEIVIAAIPAHEPNIAVVTLLAAINDGVAASGQLAAGPARVGDGIRIVFAVVALFRAVNPAIAAGRAGPKPAQC
jgi:hypothetical protein